MDGLDDGGDQGGGGEEEAHSGFEPHSMRGISIFIIFDMYICSRILPNSCEFLTRIKIVIS